MTQPAQYISGRTVQEQMNELISYVDTRAAEVATDAIASDVAQVHQDMLDADADAQAAAASAAAAAGTLANAVKKTGESSQSIAGDIAVSGDLDVGGDADVTGALDVTGAITGNDASLIGTVTVPTEPTGTFTMKSANGTKVKNELDNYAPMVRTSGNQEISGDKTFIGNFIHKNQYPNIRNVISDIDIITNTTSYQDRGNINWDDKNLVRIGQLRFNINSNGTTMIQAVVRNSNGTLKYVTIAQGDVI